MCLNKFNKKLIWQYLLMAKGLFVMNNDIY